MPWIKRGLICEINGKCGVVTAGDGSYVRVRYDGDKHSVRCHPHWQAVYYNDDGTILKDYRDAN